jgi:predicted nucleic acid-binding protein
MAVKVVDASALAALLFGEPEAQDVAGRLEDGNLVAPALLSFEIASVCLKKLRNGPQQREALLAAFALYARMPIEIVEIDHADTLRLAEAFGLSSYDA